MSLGIYLNGVPLFRVSIFCGFQKVFTSLISDDGLLVEQARRSDPDRPPKWIEWYQSNNMARDKCYPLDSNNLTA